MDASALQNMIEIAMDPEMEPFDAKSAANSKRRLLQTFIVRGLFNMIKILKSEFVEFVQRFDLLKKFITFLLKNAEAKRNKDDVMTSANFFEIQADKLREEIFISDNGSLATPPDADDEARDGEENKNEEKSN